MAGKSAAKAALRKEIQSIIASICPAEKQRQSAKIFEKLLALPQYQQSKRVSVYLSTKDEVDTIPILRDMFEMGKEVFVPKYKGKDMCMVKLISMDDYEQLPLTKWNIKQPSVKDVREDALETGGLDLIVLPGVAFTKTGKRLGHGMGYYDKFLKHCFEQQQNKPYLAAIAFNEQLREDIPTTEHDVNLDIVLSEQ